jgi:lysozyme family protein
MLDDPIVDEILVSEGWPRFTDAANDRGGPTKGGITLATLAAHRGRRVSVDDLRALSESEARLIYAERYITGPRFDAIPDFLLRWQVVDCGVHSGPPTAAKWLQSAAGVAADGVVGDVTLRAVAAADPHVLALRVAAQRARHLGRLIEIDRRQAEWAHGWMRRAMAFVEREAGRAERETRTTAATAARRTP